MADYTNYNSDNISIVKIGNKNYTIVDNPLRSSFKKLSDVIKTNNQTVKDFMDQSNFQHATTAYQLNDSNSFLYAFSNICLDKISNLETNKADKTTVTTLSNTVVNNKKSIDDTLGSVDSEKGLLYDISYLYGVVGKTEENGLRKYLISYNTRINNLENNKLDTSTFNDKIGSTQIQGTVTGVLSDLYNKVGNPQTKNTIIHSIGELEAIVGTDETKGLRKDVAYLKTTVGNESSGLVKKVADLDGNKADATVVREINTRVGALESTVGNASSGLVLKVNTNSSQLASLNNTKADKNDVNTISTNVTSLQNIVGTDNLKGLRKDVVDLKGTIGNTSGGMVKTLSQHETTINNLIKYKANQTTVDSLSEKIKELTNSLNDLTNRVKELENMSYY